MGEAKAVYVWIGNLVWENEEIDPDWFDMMVVVVGERRFETLSLSKKKMKNQMKEEERRKKQLHYTTQWSHWVGIGTYYIHAPSLPLVLNFLSFFILLLLPFTRLVYYYLI